MPDEDKLKWILLAVEKTPAYLVSVEFVFTCNIISLLMNCFELFQAELYRFNIEHPMTLQNPSQYIVLNENEELIKNR